MFFLGLQVVVRLEGRTDLHACLVEQFLPFQLLPGCYLHLFQLSVFCKRDGGMVEQVVVDDVVHTAVAEQRLDMAAQFFA